MRRRIHLPTLVTILAIAACNVTTFVPNEDYCGDNGGDSYCESLAAETPYCVLNTWDCFESADLSALGFGCVVDEPTAECREECGGGDNCTDPTVAESSSSSGETEPCVPT